MKTFTLFISLLSSIFGATAAEKTAQMDSKTKETMAKINKVAGITDKVKSIQTVTQNGKMLIPAMQMKGEVKVVTKADKIYVESRMASMVEKQAVTGDKGWGHSMATGIRNLTPQEIGTLQGDTMKYMFAQEKFYDTIKLEGNENFAGKDCIKIILTKAGMKPSIQYFDAKTYMPVGEIQIIASPMGEMKAEIVIKEIERHKLGFLFPKALEQTVGPMKMNLIIESIEVDKEIDDKLFEKPTN
ncbi:MAG: hypothetical protein MK132_19105 [Lentisphaerales bacterium]|nr:hypothetical protein [Lentisphaerales bacterium]